MLSVSSVSLVIRGIIFVLFLKSFIEWCIRRWKFVNTVNKIPGFGGLPIIGSTWLALHARRQDIIDIALARPKFFEGGINCGWLGPFAEVRVNKAELAQEVLTSKKCFPKALQVYSIMLEPWIGKGLVLASGERWHKLRRFLTTAFHFDILARYCEVFREKSEVMVEILAEKCRNREEFDIAGYLYRLTFDGVLETAFGIQPNIQREMECEYLTASEKYGNLAQLRNRNPFLHINFLFKLSRLGREFKKQQNILHDFTKNVIKNRRRELLDQNSNKIDISQRSFLDFLLIESQTKPFLTDEAIREEVDTFMFAGHDTTATALSWMIFLIGNHPDVQQKIYEEQLSFFGAVKTSPTQTDLRKMEYLERVMKECLRLQPSVPVISRSVTEDMELGGYVVPAGVMLSVNIYEIHRDPRYFPNPEKFDPDRFLPENVTDRHPFAFIPFVAAHRSCIGQKFAMLFMKTALATFFRNFKVFAMDTIDKVGTIRELVAKPCPGINVKIEKRP